MNALAKTFEDDEPVSFSGYFAPKTFNGRVNQALLSNVTVPFTEIPANALDYSNIKKPAFQKPLPTQTITCLRPFQLLQQWEGRVTEMNSDSFFAVISDQNNPKNPEEHVEISMMDIPWRKQWHRLSKL